MLGEGGELEAGRDEAVAQAGLGEDQPAGGAVQRRLDAVEVVRGALGGAELRPGDDGRVVAAHELLELGLGLAQVARREVGGLGADLDRLVAADAGQPRLGPLGERLVDLRRVDVEVARVLVVERRADVLPVVAQRRLDVLLGGDDDLRALRDQLEQRVEVLDRQQLGDVRAVLVGRGDLGQLAVLGRELGRGRDLDAVGLPQAALGEGARTSAAPRSRCRTGRRGPRAPRSPGRRRAGRRGSRTGRGPRPGRRAGSRRRRAAGRSRRGRAGRRP